MGNRINLLIADDNPKFAEMCGEILGSHGFNATVEKNDGLAVMRSLTENEPDAALISVSLHHIDGIEVMHRLTVGKKKIFTKFILMSNAPNSFIEREALEKGASYFLSKPLDFTFLSDRIRSLAGIAHAEKMQYMHMIDFPDFDSSDSAKTLEHEITEIMHRIGVPVHFKGYYYLREAILLAVGDVTYLSRVTKALYPQIARNFGTTSSRVERAIRHAIEVAWDCCDDESATAYFGRFSGDIRPKPSNSEFIAMIADTLRLKRNTVSV